MSPEIQEMQRPFFCGKGPFWDGQVRMRRPTYRHDRGWVESQAGMQLAAY